MKLVLWDEKSVWIYTSGPAVQGGEDLCAGQESALQFFELLLHRFQSGLEECGLGYRRKSGCPASL